MKNKNGFKEHQEARKTKSKDACSASMESADAGPLHPGQRSAWSFGLAQFWLIVFGE